MLLGGAGFGLAAGMDEASMPGGIALVMKSELSLWKKLVKDFGIKQNGLDVPW